MGQGGTPTGTAKEGYRPSTAKSRRQVAGCDHKKGRELDGPEPVHTCVDCKGGEADSLPWKMARGQGGNLIAFLLAGMRAQGARGKRLPAGQDTIRQRACATVPSMAPRPGAITVGNPDSNARQWTGFTHMAQRPQ